MNEEHDPIDIYWLHFDLRKSDKLLWILISFHISHFGLLWFCWKRENVQIAMFILLGGMMLCSERLNELLAQQQWLAHTNYFDSSGMFFTCAIAIPVVINLIIIIFVWIKTAGNTLVQLKRRQIKDKIRAAKTAEEKKDE